MNNTTHLTVHPLGGKDFGADWNNWVNYGVLFVALPIIIVNIVGNTLTILAFFIDPHLRSSNQNIYIINLAITDLITGTMIIPVHLYYTMNGLNWEFGLTYCRTHLAFDLWLKAEASISLILISYDRMVMIRDGENYDHVESRKKALRLIGLTWILSFVVYFPVHFYFELVWKRGTLLNNGRCHAKFNADGTVVSAMIIAVIEFMYPVVFLATFCSLLVRAILQRGKVLKQLSQEFVVEHLLMDMERTLCWCLCFMVAFYAICWTPYTLAVLASTVCEKCVRGDVLEYLIWLLWLNTSVNPFHYAHADARFRAHFKRMLVPCYFSKVLPVPSAIRTISPVQTPTERRIPPESFPLSGLVYHVPVDVGLFRSPILSPEIGTEQQMVTIKSPPTTASSQTPHTSHHRAPVNLLHTHLQQWHSQHGLHVPGETTHYHPSHHIMDMVDFDQMLHLTRSTHTTHSFNMHRATNNKRQTGHNEDQLPGTPVHHVTGECGLQTKYLP